MGITKKGADDLALQFEQLVSDFEVFGMDIAEFGNLVFTEDVCSTDTNSDNTDDQNSDNQPDENSQDDTQSDTDKLVEYENQFDVFDEEYDDFRNDLEEAENDNDEDEIDDIKDDLKDLYDDVDDLYDELVQFKGIVPEHLKDDVSDLKDDVKELKNKIKCLKNEDLSSCDDNYDNDVSDYSYTYEPSSTTTNNNQNTVATKQVEEVDLITTSVQPPKELVSESTSSVDNDVVKFTESNTYFAMLISGFIMLLGIAVFLGAIVVRLY